MGAQLAGLVEARPALAEDVRGRRVAVDEPNLAYAFYAVQLLGGAVDEARRLAAVRAAARGVAARVGDLKDRGAREVVLVLDGPPHPLKMRLLAERNASRSVPMMTRTDHALVAEAAQAAGARVVRAPHDAEAQACAMSARGHVDVVATTDWDALAMGATALLRNLAAHPSKPGKRVWSWVDAGPALDRMGVDRERLAVAFVLMGCDYFEGFPGVGPRKALKLAATLGLAESLRALGADEAQAMGARAAFDLLLRPPHGPLDGP